MLRTIAARRLRSIIPLAFGLGSSLVLGACAPSPEVQPPTEVAAAATPSDSGAPPSIHWDDGDSGTFNGQRFRLANVDAPETGGVGAYGGAKCEAERILGAAAKKFIEEVTKGADVTVAHDHGYETREREVLDLSIDGKDIGEAGLAAGVLRPWKHDDHGKPLEDKPIWC